MEQVPKDVRPSGFWPLDQCFENPDLRDAGPFQTSTDLPSRRLGRPRDSEIRPEGKKPFSGTRTICWLCAIEERWTPVTQEAATVATSQN